MSCRTAKVIVAGMNRTRLVDVFQAVPLGTSGRQWQHPVPAIKGLEGSLLIDAEHTVCAGGLGISPITSAAFVSKSGSWKTCRSPLRPNVVLVPDACQATRH
jgi:hypothetical protein